MSRLLPSCLLLLAAWHPGPALADDPAEGGDPQGDEAEEEGADEERELEAFEPIEEEVEPEGPYEARFAPFAAAALGASLPLDELSPGGHGLVSFGAQLPWLGERLLPFLELGATTTSGSGSVEDERLPDGEAYHWEMGLRQLELGGGLRLGLLRGDASFRPELAAVVHAARVGTVLDGRVGATPTSTIHETRWTPSWRATAGIAARVGPGAITVDLGYRALELDGVMSGPVRLHGPVALIGYRRLP